MPQVKYTEKKGLHQNTGTGFVLEDNHVKSLEEIKWGVTVLTCVADVDDSLDGKYFDLSTPSAEYRFWFDTDDSGTAAPENEGRTLVEVTTIATGDPAATVASKLETAIEAAAAGAAFECSDESAAGQITIFNKVCGKTKSADSVGTSGFTLTSTDRGAGALAGKIDPDIRVSVISAPAPGAGDTALAVDGSALNKPTLAAAGYTGQEKILMRTDAVAVAIAVTMTALDDDGAADAASEDLTLVADANQRKARVASLIFCETGYARLNPGTPAFGTTGFTD